MLLRKTPVNGKGQVCLSILPTESATQLCPEERDIFPINRDHSNMAKFPPDDADYRVTAGKMRRLTEEMHMGDSNILSNLIESSYESGELPDADNIPSALK